MIAAAYARGRSFSADFYGDYLIDSIHFDFGDPEFEGLRRFFAYAAELGLIEQAPQISFF